MGLAPKLEQLEANFKNEKMRNEIIYLGYAQNLTYGQSFSLQRSNFSGVKGLIFV